MLLSTGRPLHAQALTVLYNFCSQSGCTDGGFPYAKPVQGTDGNFYGTTYKGGNNVGVIYKLTPGGTFTTLYSFCSESDCADGELPEAPLIQGSDGNFYGTTEDGGNSFFDAGTAFKITPSGTFSVLYTFCSVSTSTTSCVDGGDPVDPLVQGSDGNFYGTNPYGGIYVPGLTYTGTVFKLTPSGTLTTLYSFCPEPGCTDGYLPSSGLVEGNDGNFYGEANAGGANTNPNFNSNGGGTIFKITPSGTLTTIYSFCAVNSPNYCADGYGPIGGLILGTDGNFYGTTAAGGANLIDPDDGYYGAGTVFRITPGGTLTTLYNFCAQECTDGLSPTSGVIQGSDGNFFGTTSGGGNLLCGPATGCGTAFMLTAGGVLTTLYTFCSLQLGNGACLDGEGAAPGLIQASDGNLYGVAGGGAIGAGLVFRLAPAALLSANSLSFPSQAYNTPSSAQTVTFSNPYFGSIAVSNIAISGADAGDFSETNTCSSPLNGGDICQINVIFTPQAAGARVATLTITDDSGGVNGTTQTVNLSGAGASAPEPIAGLSVTSLAFSSQALGTTSAAQTVTLNNTGNAALSISSIAVSGDFAQTNTCGGSVPADGTCNINVTFTPAASGALTGTLMITDNNNGTVGSAQTVALSGTGVGPVVALSPTSLSFNPLFVNLTGTEQSVTLSNTGSATLSISSIAVSGTNSTAFTQTNTCGSSVAAGANCAINVIFLPAAGGSLTASLSITDNAPGSPQTVALAGTGKDFTLAPPSGSTTSASVTPGGTATYNLSVAPEGGIAGTVSFTCSGAPSDATCTINPASVALSGTGSASATVSVVTAAPSLVAPHLRFTPLRVPGSYLLPLALVLMTLLSTVLLVTYSRPPRARSVALGLALAGVLLVPACGGGGGGNAAVTSSPGTPAGNYTLTITATDTSGTITDTHTIALSLTVS